MSVPLLNDHQQRRLAAHLRLLSQDLETLALTRELKRAGDPYDRIRVIVTQARKTVDDLRGALDLPTDGAPTLQRRVAALAEVWAVRMEDLVARRLAPYGAVHPGLAEQLDPKVERLRVLLSDLAAVAQRLPEA